MYVDEAERSDYCVGDGGVPSECTGGGDGGGCTSHALKHFLFDSSERPNYPTLVPLTSQPSYYRR